MTHDERELLLALAEAVLELNPGASYLDDLVIKLLAAQDAARLPKADAVEPMWNLFGDPAESCFE